MLEYYAPSASLYGFAADCPARDREPLFTSACQGCQRTAARRVEGLGGRVIPTTPPMPHKPGRAVFGSTDRK